MQRLEGTELSLADLNLHCLEPLLEVQVPLLMLHWVGIVDDMSPGMADSQDAIVVFSSSSFPCMTRNGDEEFG